MSLQPGSYLGPYVIASPLGAGGMGEVYRAHDAKLGRDVALKVLPEAFAADTDRLSRFRREAHVLASLNHPHIAQIYGLEDSGARHALVMELVEGPTLADLIPPGRGLPLEQVAPIVRQVAEALEYAHERSVVHRDLKPANIKLAGDGIVKVLDFGLAKALERGTGASDSGSGDAALDSPTLTSPAVTGAGVILGTAAYMSPEQARGQAVDRRADIWAFGCVLYELLTGRRPFEGQTVSDTLAAVLRAEPDWEVLAPGIPAHINGLIRRCLTKDPRRRLRDIGEARVLLESAIEDGSAVGRPEAGPTAGERRRLAPVGLALTAGAVAVAFGAGYLARRPTPPPPPALGSQARIQKLTFEPGYEGEPSFSPDGSSVAYTTNGRGSLDIDVVPLSGGRIRRLVEGPADDAQPAWSPDGAKIAFTSARDRGGRLLQLRSLDQLSAWVQGRNGDIFLMAAAGGPVAKLVERGSFPAWSPDAKTIAFQSDRASGQWDIWTVPVEGGEPRPITADAEIDFQPSWSPDGRWIAFGSLGGLRVAPADGSAPPTEIVDGPAAGPSWSPAGDWIYFASSRGGAQGSLSLWRVRFPADHPATLQRVTLADTGDVDVDVASKGRRLAFTRGVNTPDLWELDVERRLLRQITSATSIEDWPHLAPDNRRLLFVSDRAGEYRGVWTYDMETGEVDPVTPAGLNASFPQWSPDGRHIAYTQADTVGDVRQSAIMVRPVGGVTARKLVSQAGTPAWSPDGHRIAYVSEVTSTLGRSGNTAVASVWTTDLEGHRTKIAEPGGQAGFPTWSPDGRTIGFQSDRDSRRQIWTVPATGGTATQLTTGALELSHPRWSPVDSGHIVVVVDHKNLALVAVPTGQLRYLTEYDDSTLYVDYPSWSADGRKIYFSITRKTGDLFLIENY